MAGPSIWSQSATLGGGGTLKGKTLVISGASRGIGLAIAQRAAADGANIVVCAKTVDRHPTLPGSIHEAVAEIERLGGKGLACVVDVRHEASIEAAVEKAVEAFGGIDILINCASAIFPTETSTIDVKKLNLMWEVTTRAPLLMAKHCVPHLKASAEAGRNPHIITCSPPVDFTHWPAPKDPRYDTPFIESIPNTTTLTLTLSLTLNLTALGLAKCNCNLGPDGNPNCNPKPK